MQLGCATKIHHFKAYDEQSVKPAELSILHVPESVKINTIDGKSGFYPRYISDISPYSGARIELLPGVHTLNVEYYIRGIVQQKGTTNLQITTRSRQSYFINAEHIMNNSKAYVHFNLYDCGSQKELEVNSERKRMSEHSLSTYPPICSDE